MGGVARRPTHGRRFSQAVIDSAAWAIALVLCSVLRLGTHGLAWWRLFPLVPLVVIAQLAAGSYFGLYRGRWVFGSVEEVGAVAKSFFVAALGLLIVDASIMYDRPLPISAVLAGGTMAVLIMVSARFWWRMDHDRQLRRSLKARGCERVIVFGAGSGGRAAISAMLADRESPYIAVALLDDDPRVRGMTARGVKVVGDRYDMQRVAAEHNASAVIIAVPSASSSVVLELSELATKAGLAVRVLPSVRELLDGRVRVVDIREPTERDLMGRHSIETDLEQAASYLRDKRVVVTGAGGSIGSELCRQIAQFAPAELIMLDRDESALHAVQLSIEGRALLDTPDLVLLDIRDRERVKRLFCERRPEVVFHAAALKHLPLLESHPVEGFKTNVWGSLAVLEAAELSGVECFVNVSTDKAADPCSMLGYSKRVAEGLTAGVDARARGRFISVRFGNVLGSRGSVLTAFQKQLEFGGPLTVTHPEATRFFMTVEESVQLVLQAGAIGDGGQVLVLDMGEPVNIAEVAEQLAQTVKPPCPIEFVGLRRGEKLHEELFGTTETPAPTVHPMIRSVPVPPLDGDRVRHFPTTLSSDLAGEALIDLCASMALQTVGADREDFPYDWGAVAGGA
ncbi:MAG TPA: nucleoside-diphosphate sugar epimerase/dehydratase [Acidimicrobiia bacterium]|nr:nucleoside-diphosphate sugar epimerase/dehydratase [Acidimicrobiia bacterium]